MAYPYLIIPDTEEFDIDAKTIHVAYNAAEVEDAIKNLSGKCPTVAICVYKLDQLAKIKTKPTYQRYVVSPTGEIVPL
jgi:hypothetical protein